jgi:hypothetical protein
MKSPQDTARYQFSRTLLGVRIACLLAVCVTLPASAEVSGQDTRTSGAPVKTELGLPAFLSGKPLREEAGDDAARKRLKSRYNAALSEARHFYIRRQRADTVDDQDELYASWQRVVRARLPLCRNPEEKIEFLTAFHEATRTVARTEEARYNAARSDIGGLKRAEFERLDAEIQLLRAQLEAEQAKRK